MKEQVFIGIGTNLGNKVRNIQRSLYEIKKIKCSTLKKVSSLYKTSPVGYLDQPNFINAACLLETYLHPEHLLDELKQIEEKIGRLKIQERWKERVIDLDILIFGNWCFKSNHLQIPHPELPYRKFAMIPILDIADPFLPPLGRPISLIMKENLNITMVDKIVKINC